MPWINEDRVTAAREVDLLTYLQEREPHELVRSRNAQSEYRTVSHGSLVISNGAWYWNRGQIGSRSAIDFLIKIRGMGLVEAVQAVEGIGGARASPSVHALAVKDSDAKREQKKLILPPRVNYPTYLLSYLQNRGIRADVIRRCLDNGSLYEGRYTPKSTGSSEPVCVFVGMDDSGKARFGCMRGINSDLKRDCAGSDKRYGFRLAPNNPDCDTLMAFESPIDSLSHFCLYPEMDTHRLSLGGTSNVSIISFLERNSQIKKVSMCLDADDAGKTAAGKIKALLEGDARFSHITTTIDLPSVGKDYSEALLYTVRHEQA